MAVHTVRVPLKDLKRHQQRLGQKFWPAVTRGMKSGAMRAIPELHRRTSKADAVNTGNYKRSWKWELVNQNTVVIHNQAPYSGVIEYGRRRGARMPPVKVLIPWVRRVLGVPPGEAESVAWAVARKIQSQGIKGKHILGKASADIVRFISQEIDHEVVEALRNP